MDDFLFVFFGYFVTSIHLIHAYYGCKLFDIKSSSVEITLLLGLKVRGIVKASFVSSA